MSTRLYVAANGMGPMNKGSIVVAVLQRSDRLEPRCMVENGLDDLRPLNFGLTTARQRALDRPTWHQLL